MSFSAVSIFVAGALQQPECLIVPSQSDVRESLQYEYGTYSVFDRRPS